MRQYLPVNYGVVVPLFFSILSYIILPSSMRLQTIFISIISMCGYLLTVKLIPFVKELCLKANLYGKDINKNTDEKIPESLGIVTGTVFLLCVILFQPFFPKIQEYNAATTAICFTILIGFLDDVLNLKWSIKIALSFLGAVPLLVSYAGVTKIVVPKPFRELLGLEIELALLYHLYMVLLAVFCTNSINIYAGINGLEVGQSLIISASIIIHNLVEIYLHNSNTNVDVQNHVLGHLFSLSMMLPFISTTFGLFYFNFYPSRVFVGDSFTYFSGMALVVAGILGKFSKTLMLFFIPQAINFLISLPQLFNVKLIPGLIYPCPRHRLAKYVKETGKLHYTNNGNLLNLFLYIFGDISEHNLCIYLIIFQILCSCVAFFIRYTVANWFY